MFSVRELTSVAEDILGEEPDAAVRLRLLRDVLRLPSDHAPVRAARRLVEQSRAVRELAAEQRADGSWGRFHTMDYGLKRRWGTTEGGVDRAVILGLDRRHPILRRACTYTASILADWRRMPDRERNASWPTGATPFAAATLAEIDPSHRALGKTAASWAAIAERTFRSGGYDPVAEAQAHRAVHGIPGEVAGYLRLRNKYSLRLLGSAPGLLCRETERAMLRWLLSLPNGLCYLDVCLGRAPERLGKFGRDAWFTSWEILSRYATWRGVASDAVIWLWAQRLESGRWDLGQRSTCSTYFPLSDSWRRPCARQHDWTTRVLVLLRRYTDPPMG